MKKITSLFSFSSILTFYFAIAPLLVSSFASLWIIQNEAQLQSIFTNQIVFCTLICVFTCIIALSPPTLLASIWGYFLGWWSIIPLILINLFGIIGIYFLAIFSNSKHLLSFIENNPKTKTLLSKLHKNEFQFVFYTKLSPVLPFALTNFVFATARIKLKNMILGGMIGMLPRTFLAIWIGSQVKEFRTLVNSSNDNLFTKLLVFLLVVISVLGLFRLIKRNL